MNTTKISLFFANYNKKFNLFELKFCHVFAQSTMKHVKTFKNIHSNIVRMQQKFIVYQNKKQKLMPQLKNKNKIYLLTKNLKTKKISKKFDYIKIGLFFVNKQIKSVNYKLDLLPNTKIHSIFYVLLLKSIDSKTFIQDIFHFQYKKKDENEIKTILAQDDQRYFIK